MAIAKKTPDGLCPDRGYAILLELSVICGCCKMPPYPERLPDRPVPPLF